jgi:pSer/pThr/pTyr-binding forkhead associated (FHA) protein
MPSRSTWVLLVEDRFGAVSDEVSLDAGQVIVGRSRQCDIVLPSENVSRRHARLVVEGGRLRVEDLGASNGVWLNDQRVPGSADLAEGDSLRVGDYHLRVRGGRRAEDRVVHARLVGRSPGVQQQSLELTSGTVLVGRGRDCGLVLVDPSVSRVHARLLSRPDGAVLVEDVGSANGLFVNDTRVKVWQLSAGDRVRFGNVEFVVDLPGSGTVQTPALTGRLRAFLSRAWPWLVAGTGLAVLVVVLAVALPRLRAPSGDAGARPPATPVPVEPASAPAPPAADTLARARDLLAARHLEEARIEVAALLRSDPANVDAMQLSNRLDLERMAAEALGGADAALAEGRYEAAIQALFSVPPDSGYAGDAKARLRTVRPSLEQSRDQACAGRGARGVPCLRLKALLGKVEAASR